MTERHYYPIIPLWVNGRWNEAADPQCTKCLMGLPHLVDKHGKPIHNKRAYNTERYYREG